MAKEIARQRITKMYPTLHSDVVIEEIDCTVLEHKPVRYTYEKEVVHSPGRLIYIVDNSPEGGVVGDDHILHILLTERGTFVSATAHNTYITPDEIDAASKVRISSPLGDPQYVGKMTLVEALAHMRQLTPAARQERMEDYARIKAGLDNYAREQEEKARAAREKVYRQNERWLLEQQGLTPAQTAAVLAHFDVKL